MDEPTIEEFKVVAVSDNTNSFGLRQMISVSRHGKVFKACGNSLNTMSKGTTFCLSIKGSHVKKMPRSWELPELLPDLAPPDVTNEAWPTSA
jgi:hypothetical protein